MRKRGNQTNMDNTELSNKLNLFCFTFNCQKSAPLNSQFANELSNINLNYSDDGNNAEDEEGTPEILVFGFQELSTLLDGTNANVINQKLISLSQLINHSLSNKFGIDFQTISINHFGSVGLIITSPYKSRFKAVLKSIDPPLGYLLTSTKGATGLRISYQQPTEPTPVELTFVVAHLNANEGLKYLLRRNIDTKSIFQGMKFNDNWGVLKPETHCFVMGDLNYRAIGFSNFNGGGVGDAEEPLINTNNEFDFNKDELDIMRRKGDIFWGFDEARITFKPTYKFKVGTNTYNDKRTPSWCDRILYLRYGYQTEFGVIDRDDNGLDNVLDYNSLPNLKISDHIPVYLKIKVPYKPPPSIINSKGYLIDAFTNLSVNELYLKPLKTWDYLRLMGIYVDDVLGFALFLGCTNKGRLIFFILLSLIFIIAKYFYF